MGDAFVVARERATVLLAPRLLRPAALPTVLVNRGILPRGFVCIREILHRLLGVRRCIRNPAKHSDGFQTLLREFPTRNPEDQKLKFAVALFVSGQTAICNFQFAIFNSLPLDLTVRKQLAGEPLPLSDAFHFSRHGVDRQFHAF